MMSRTLRGRLERRAPLLALIDQRRAESGAPHLGANIERLIIERELRELEATISGDNPTSDTLRTLPIVR
jgi:hypothetical protein